MNEKLPNAKDMEKVIKLKVLEPTALLIRDFQNYVTALHPDAAHRLLALMFYMPQDDCTLCLGTSIYRPMMILKIPSI